MVQKWLVIMVLLLVFLVKWVWSPPWGFHHIFNGETISTLCAPFCWTTAFTNQQTLLGDLPPPPPGAAQHMNELLEFAKHGRTHHRNDSSSKPSVGRHLFHSQVNDVYEWRIFWLMDDNTCGRRKSEDETARAFLSEALHRIKRTARYLDFKPDFSVKIPNRPEVRRDDYVDLGQEESGLKVRGLPGTESDASSEPMIELKVRLRVHAFRNPIWSEPVQIEVWDKTLRRAFDAAQVRNISEMKRVLREHATMIDQTSGGILGDANAGDGLAFKVRKTEKSLPNHSSAIRLVQLKKRRYRAEMQLAARRRRGTYKMEITDVQTEACHWRWQSMSSNHAQCYRSFAIEGTNPSAVALFAMVTHDMVRNASHASEWIGGYPSWIHGICQRSWW